MNGHEGFSADRLAEATALGVVIMDPDCAATVFSIARVEDFDPPFSMVAEAIHRLRLNRTSIDQLAVVDEMTRCGTIGRAGGSAFVFELVNYSYSGCGGAEHAAHMIAARARRRRLWKVTSRAALDVQSEEADPLRIAQQIATEAQGVIDSIENEGDVSTPTLGEFIAKEDEPYDWVVPDLMERGDRLVLTGDEGGGKSVLLRQVAVMAAAGLHPFSQETIRPQRVLYVDCENGVAKLRRHYRSLAKIASRFGSDPRLNLYVEPVPAGLNLARAEDETWLVRRVAGLQPDLLIIGPAYRLYVDDPNDEKVVRAVARVLDRCRATTNCALVLEAHAGHGMDGRHRNVRPTGSSLWLRWPEFGYGLRKADDWSKDNRNVEFVSWRGDREERQWPEALAMGGTWPWRVRDTWSPSARAV